MSQNESVIFELEANIKESVKYLSSVDGISMAELNSLAGYEGTRSLSNVLNGAHSLPAERFCSIALGVEERYHNYRLTKFMINTNNSLVVPRPRLDKAKGGIEYHAMDIIKTTVEASNYSAYDKYPELYAQLLHLASLVKAEYDAMSSVLARKSVSEEAA